MESPAPLIAFDNSYARLGDRFSVSLSPDPVRAPRLIRLNRPLCAELGLDADALDNPAGADFFSGNVIMEGSEPLAMAYAGHQFGHWVHQLGDGRAHLLGELLDRNGQRRDIQLKGSGRTPFSRMGDGRAALGPVLREYIVSEGMAGLGIPATRALAMVATGERVLRQDGPEPGGILTRVARSHIRVGTFQYFLARQDENALRILADYVIDRHYPTVKTAENPYAALLDAVIARTARLIAQWQLVGFIHGVMNTDNQSIVAETIDFGPCAFLDAYHPDKVFSSIDQAGRYRYRHQPAMAFWNLTRLAEALLSLIHAEEKTAIAQAEQALDSFGAAFDGAIHAGWCAKMGLTCAQDGDSALTQALLDIMADQAADFTRTFRALSHLNAHDAAKDAAFLSEFTNPQAAEPWLIQWRARLKREERSDADRQAAMQAVNPKYIPRNHQVQRVIDAFYRGQEPMILDEFLTVLARPFDEHPTLENYAAAPDPAEMVKRTFCGT